MYIINFKKGKGYMTLIVRLFQLWSHFSSQDYKNWRGQHKWVTTVYTKSILLSIYILPPFLAENSLFLTKSVLSGFFVIFEIEYVILLDVMYQNVTLQVILSTFLCRFIFCIHFWPETGVFNISKNSPEGTNIGQEWMQNTS